MAYKPGTVGNGYLDSVLRIECRPAVEPFSREDIIKSYPHLSKEAVEQALRYAARFLKNEIVVTGRVTE